MDPRSQNSIQMEKVVSVKVLERKGGTVLIDINGLKTEAVLETKIPDNFLAMVEKDLNNTVKLRVISLMKQNKGFTDQNKVKLEENIKSFLMEKQLPATESYIKLALKLHSAGVKLDPGYLRILNSAANQYGDYFVSVLVTILKNGFKFDKDFPEFLKNLKSFIKLLQEDHGQKNSKPDLKTVLSGLDKSEWENGLNLLLVRCSDKNLYYDNAVFEFQDEECFLQVRKTGEKEKKRFYFNLSGAQTGNVLLVIDQLDSAYDIKLYLEDGLYQRTNSNNSENTRILQKKITGLLPDIQLNISILVLDNPYLFWMDEEEYLNTDIDYISNLDISV